MLPYADRISAEAFDLVMSALRLYIDLLVSTSFKEASVRLLRSTPSANKPGPESRENTGSTRGRRASDNWHQTDPATQVRDGPLRKLGDSKPFLGPTQSAA
jgi:hypothetical protein